MPTVDIISPGGAFTPAAAGDTQELTTTFTISSGSPNLTCNGASPFVSGDTGKTFTLSLGGNQGPTGTFLGGTLTYVSSTQVTLSVNATSNLSATSATLIWGTDDAPAFRAFNTWAQSQVSPITLTLGTGAKSFIFGSADSNGIRSNSISWNIPVALTVTGNGNSTTKFYSSIGTGPSWGAPNALKTGDGHYTDQSWTARLNTVNAGATTLICKAPTDASQFSTNTWALITGIDMQGSGDPINPFWFEYVYITNISGGTITIQSPLVNTYLDSWPVFQPWSAGFHVDEGGPATLYAIDPGWNINVIYQNFGINGSAGGQSYGAGYNVQWQGVKQYDTYGITPTFTNFVSFTGCDLSSYQMEYDKCVYKCVFDSTTTAQLFIQSSNNLVIVQNGCNIAGGFNGTPRVLEVHDSTVGGIGLGPPFAGRTDSFITTNSTISSTMYYGSSSDSSAIQTDYSMSGGVITIPRSTLTYACRWMIPGQVCYFGGNNTAWVMFKVLTVTGDATNIYVTTDWPYGGFPSWALQIKTVPSLYVNFASNTSSTDPTTTNLVAATSAGYSKPSVYTIATFNGGNLGIDATGLTATFPQATGKLVSYTINVTTPYTGAQSTLFWHAFAEFDNATIVKSDLSTTTYGPHIDLRTAGIRTITPAGANLLGSDSALAVPSSPTWICGAPGGGTTSGGLCASQNIQAEYNGNPSVGPVLTIILITDQGTGSASITGQGGIFAIQNQSNMVIRGRTR